VTCTRGRGIRTKREGEVSLLQRVVQDLGDKIDQASIQVVAPGWPAIGQTVIRWNSSKRRLCLLRMAFRRIKR
jgi:hypothetical protein